MFIKKAILYIIWSIYDKRTLKIYKRKHKE